MPASPTGISSLALEELQQILDEVALLDQTSIFHCSLVCRYLKEHSLDRLYRHIGITSENQLRALAQSPSLPRFRTTSLQIVIDVGLKKPVLQQGTLKTVVDRCIGLRKLHMEGNGIPVVAIEPLLARSALSALQSLTLKSIGLAENHPFHPAGPDPNRIPLLLRVLLYPDRLSSRPPTETLSSLDLSGVRSDFELIGLPRVYAAAAGLKSIALPPIDNGALLQGVGHPSNGVATFLKRALHLKHLTLHTDHNSNSADFAIVVSSFLVALPSLLTTFTLRCAANILSANLFKLILDNMMKVGLCLSLLKELRLPDVSLSKLKEVKEGANFVALVEASGKKLVCKE